MESGEYEATREAEVPAKVAEADVRADAKPGDVEPPRAGGGGGGRLVLRSYKGSDFFGELALMYDAKRAATVTCTAAGTVHVLTRDVRLARRRLANTRSL